MLGRLRLTAPAGPVRWFFLAVHQIRYLVAAYVFLRGMRVFGLSQLREAFLAY